MQQSDRLLRRARIWGDFMFIGLEWKTPIITGAKTSLRVREAKEKYSISRESNKFA